MTSTLLFRLSYLLQERDQKERTMDSHSDQGSEGKGFDMRHGNIEFGSPDDYDMTALLELNLVDPDIDSEHNEQNKVQQLKNYYIGKSCKISCCYSLIIFCFIFLSLANVIYCEKVGYGFQRHIMI